MATTGALAFTAAADAEGIGTATWTNPTNCLTGGDAAWATDGAAGGVTTHYLQATALTGAALASVGDTDTVSQVQISVIRQKQGPGLTSGILDNRACLIVDGTVVTANNQKNLSAWSNTSETITYTFSGLSLTGAQLKASNFGFALAADTNWTAGGNVIAAVDSISLADATYAPSAVPPVIGTPASSSIAETTATLGATVTNVGTPESTEMGVVVGTSANPTTASPLKWTSTPVQVGAFTVSATGLTAGTAYHFRGYITNSGGTVYTDDATFTTDTPPTVSLPTASVTGATTATLGATVGNAGTPEATEMGVCIGASANPTIAGTKFTKSPIATGAFTVNATILTGGTLYHYRGYITNENGTVYTSDATFTTHTAPALTTPVSSNIGQHSAQLGATVTGLGDPEATEIGVVVGLSANPTVASVWKWTAAVGTGAFTVQTSPLPANSTLHYRAFITNADGTVYTTDDTFVTLAETSEPEELPAILLEEVFTMPIRNGAIQAAFSAVTSTSDGASSAAINMRNGKTLLVTHLVSGSGSTGGYITCTHSDSEDGTYVTHHGEGTNIPSGASASSYTCVFKNCLPWVKLAIHITDKTHTVKYQVCVV